MKKILAIALAAAMMLSMAACGTTDDNDATDDVVTNAPETTEDTDSTDAPETTEGTEGTEDTEGTEGTEGTDDTEEPAQETGAQSALEILDTVWATYAEDEMFSVMGGTGTMNEPDSVAIEGNESFIENDLVFPAESLELVDDVASLIHMLNANTFTCGVFGVTDAENIASIAEGIKDKVVNNQWLCGFPQKLVISEVGDYIVSAFGNEEIIDIFQSKLESSYADAELLYEESLL